MPARSLVRVHKPAVSTLILRQPKNGKNNPTSGAMVNAITDKQWSTTDLVFDGAYNCATNDGGATGKSIARFTDQGTFDFSCPSQLEVHDGCQDLSLGWQYGCNAFFERHRELLVAPTAPGVVTSNHSTIFPLFQIRTATEVFHRFVFYYHQHCRTWPWRHNY